MVLLDLLAMKPVFSVLKDIPSLMFSVSRIAVSSNFQNNCGVSFSISKRKKLRFKGKKCCFKNHVLFTICHGGVFLPAHNFNTFLSVCLKQEDKTFCPTASVPIRDKSELIQHSVSIRGYIAILWKKSHFFPNWLNWYTLTFRVKGAISWIIFL